MESYLISGFRYASFVTFPLKLSEELLLDFAELLLDVSAGSTSLELLLKMTVSGNSAVMYFSKAATVSPMSQDSMFLRMESRPLPAMASAAQSAIVAFAVESFHKPVSANESVNLSMRFASPASSVSACIITLTARSAALPSPPSKMFRFSNSSKLPAMSNAASTSCSACVFASANVLPFSVTRCKRRSYSSSVSTLIFTFSRSFKSVNAWSVNSFEDFLPVISLR